MEKNDILALYTLATSILINIITLIVIYCMNGQIDDMTQWTRSYLQNDKIEWSLDKKTFILEESLGINVRACEVE